MLLNATRPQHLHVAGVEAIVVVGKVELLSFFFVPAVVLLEGLVDHEADLALSDSLLRISEEATIDWLSQDPISGGHLEVAGCFWRHEVPWSGVLLFSDFFRLGRSHVDVITIVSPGWLLRW